MQLSVPDGIAEIVEIVFELVLTILFTIVGLGAEVQSFEAFGNDVTMALWFGYMGTLALYAGVVKLGSNRVLPRLRNRFSIDY